MSNTKNLPKSVRRLIRELKKHEWFVKYRVGIRCARGSDDHCPLSMRLNDMKDSGELEYNWPISSTTAASYYPNHLRALGMTRQTATRIVCAADTTRYIPHKGWRNEEHYNLYRNALLSLVKSGEKEV